MFHQKNYEPYSLMNYAAFKWGRIYLHRKRPERGVYWHPCCYCLAVLFLQGHRLNGKHSVHMTSCVIITCLNIVKTVPVKSRWVCVCKPIWKEKPLRAPANIIFIICAVYLLLFQSHDQSCLCVRHARCTGTWKKKKRRGAAVCVKGLDHLMSRDHLSLSHSECIYLCCDMGSHCAH